MNWVETLNLSGRGEPDFYLKNSDYGDLPYAPELKSAVNNLNLDGFFCIQDIPVVMFKQMDRLDPAYVSNAHKALWNLGLAEVLIIVTPDLVYVLSLAQSPSANPISDTKDSRLVEILNIVSDTVAIKEFISGIESGRWVNERKERFPNKERIDNKLLANLTSTKDELASSCGMPPSSAQILIMQVMFIAYLEDRNILVPEYFSETCRNNSILGLHDLLSSNNPNYLKKIFKKLNEDFNGSLFSTIGGFENSNASDITKYHLDVLFRFRDGRIDLRTGQTSFWPYEFNYIPVELVSAVYDRFLATDSKKQRDNGEYYTPLSLAELVSAQSLGALSKSITSDSKFTVLDPACGSGIFLVRIFQKLVQIWRNNHNGRKPSWKTLTNIIRRIHGHDIDPGAINVTLFSLYVTMLEQVNPSDIRILMDKGHLLPVLLGDTLRAVDYFDDNDLGIKFDLIIGNPPWVSRKKDKASKALEWAANNKKPIPASEIAWAFTWKSLTHIKEEGKISFILPAMSYLANHHPKTIAARNELFRNIHVHEIINLADIRFLLFDNAKRPAAVIVYGKKKTGLDNYRFNYYVPKGDLNMVHGDILTISPYDKGYLSSDSLIDNPYIFRQWMWMSTVESRVHKWLDSFPKLREIAISYDDYKKSKHRKY